MNQICVDYEESEFECPLQQVIQHFDKFTSLWDYFTHLIKCKGINQFLETNPDQRFFICCKCGQSFFTKVDRDAHHFICKPREGHFQILRDNIDELQIGLKGKGKVKELIQMQQELFKEPCDDKQMDIEPDLIEIEPRGRKIVNQSGQQKKIDKETFECYLFNGKIQLQSVFHKLHNQFPKIQQLHKYYDTMMNQEELEIIFKKYEIPFNPNVFKVNKVCEFIEDSQINQMNLEYNRVLCHIKKGQHDQIWILVHETNQYFNKFFDEFPWAMFCIQTKYDFNLLELDSSSNDEKVINRLIAEQREKNEKNRLLSLTLENQIRELNQTNQHKQIKIFKLEQQLQQQLIKLNQSQFNLSELENQINAQLLQKEQQGKEEMQNYFLEQKQHFDQEHEEKKQELQQQIVSQLYIQYFLEYF